MPSTGAGLAAAPFSALCAEIPWQNGSPRESAGFGGKARIRAGELYRRGFLPRAFTDEGHGPFLKTLL